MTSIVHLSGCQNHRCAYCSVAMELIQLDRGPRKPRREKPPQGKSWGAYQRSKKYRRATRDHFIPIGFGGPDTEDNQIAACWWCNNYRGNQPAEVAFDRIQRLVKRGTHPHIAFERDGHMPKFNMLRTIPPAPREPSFSVSPRTDQPSSPASPAP